MPWHGSGRAWVSVEADTRRRQGRAPKQTAASAALRHQQRPQGRQDSHPQGQQDGHRAPLTSIALPSRPPRSDHFVLRMKGEKKKYLDLKIGEIYRADSALVINKTGQQTLQEG